MACNRSIEQRWRGRGGACPSFDLRPSTLFILGEKTNLQIEEIRLGALQTGTGIGGSGGIKEGRVREVTFENVGHMFPLQAVARTAKEMAPWLGQESARWLEEERAWVAQREKRKANGENIGFELTKEMRELVKPPKMPSTSKKPTGGSKL